MGNIVACQESACRIDQLLADDALAMSISNVEPWCAKDVISGRLSKHEDVQRRTPFRFIHVQDGLSHFARHCRDSRGRYNSEQFADVAEQLLVAMQTPGDRHDLNEVFKAIDLDNSGFVCHQAIVASLAGIFKGSIEDRTRAVFESLDLDGRGVLTKQMVIEYLCPLVKAMVPEEAASFRSILLSKAADDIFADMDPGAGSLAREELVQWVCRSGTPVWLDTNEIFVDQLAGAVNNGFFEVWGRCHRLVMRSQSGTWRERGKSLCGEDLVSSIGSSNAKWSTSRKVVAL